MAPRCARRRPPTWSSSASARARPPPSTSVAARSPGPASGRSTPSRPGRPSSMWRPAACAGRTRTSACCRSAGVSTTRVVGVVLGSGQLAVPLVPRVDPAAHGAGVAAVHPVDLGTALAALGAGDLWWPTHAVRLPARWAAGRQMTSRTSDCTPTQSPVAALALHTMDSSWPPLPLDRRVCRESHSASGQAGAVGGVRMPRRRPTGAGPTWWWPPARRRRWEHPRGCGADRFPS